MTATAETAAAYRVRGTTDEMTTCEICGKPELKGTVVLEALDADGNADGVTYAGSTCAAKLTGRKSAVIRHDAAAADLKRRQAVEWTAERLGWWEPIEFDRAAIRDLYFGANPSQRGHVNCIERVAEILAECRETIATAGLSALRSAA